KETKKFKCPYCSKLFRRKSDCVRHSRIHTGFRPYQCCQCDASYARQDALLRHYKNNEMCKSKFESSAPKSFHGKKRRLK
ncbi:hypothetical protein BKA69DRAFT_1019151, partial [Paraphysoderma sedebokerense]